MDGYTGMVLRVNLSTGAILEEELNSKWAEQYIGGRGLGMKYSSEMGLTSIEALSPHNPLMFFTGPLTGTRAPTSGRICSVFISPLTNLISYSNCGGFFGARLKRAGYDGLIIEGKAESPVYLTIFNGDVSIEDAREIWGQNTSTTEKWIKQTHGKRVSSACIGIAGENQVPISTIMADRISAFGRTGAGAVMGSKNLKAIAVAGENDVPLHNEDKFKEIVEMAFSLLKENPVTGEALKTMGTCSLVHVINANGIFPVRNFQENYWDFEKAEMISGEFIQNTLKKKNVACYNCPIACKQLLEVDGETFKGPEYETDWAFGGNIDNWDVRSIIRAQELCNEYGIDPISLGSAIACIMELKENGISKIKLDWSDTKKTLKLIHQTAKREGIGEILGKGAKKVAEQFGKPEFAMHVKGLELPAYDPRGVQGLGLSYATSNRGGCHLAGYTIPLEIFSVPRSVDRFGIKDKAIWVKYKQDIGAFIDSLVVCKFTSFALGPDIFAEMMKYATGFEINTNKLFLAGERIYNLERVMNLKREPDLKDTLPDRLLKSRTHKGPSKGNVVNLKPMIKEYYSLRGWDEMGRPIPAKLAELGIEVES